MHKLLFLIVCAVGASALGTQILTNAYGRMFYPTAIRSTADLANMITRRTEPRIKLH